MNIPGVLFKIAVPTAQHELKQRIATSHKLHRSNIDSKRLDTSTAKSEDYIYDTDNVDGSMEKTLMNLLDQFRIQQYQLMRDDNPSRSFVHVEFCLRKGESCERLLQQLTANNIGSGLQSTVAVLPCHIYYHRSSIASSDEDGADVSCGEVVDGDGDKCRKKCEKGQWSKFIRSMRARLAISQVSEQVRADAALTFNFIVLVIISTLMCAIGLVENSDVFLLSSMVICPMMRPVMAATLGTAIQNSELRRIGVRSEFIGLLIATIVGFTTGCVICLCTDKYGETDWPTDQMISRGKIWTLGVGCLIALLSGAAVAVGMLIDNTASLVGVAISTSLMPPAVNAGLLWSMTFVYYFKAPEHARYASLSYTEYFSKDRVIELTCLGAVSLCLTFVNIICIYVACILVFKLKEVTPIASPSKTRRQFWRDVKFARDYTKFNSNDDDLNVPADVKKMVRFHDLHHHSTDMSHGTIPVHVGRCQYTWSPCYTDYHQRPSILKLKELHELMHQNCNVATSGIAVAKDATTSEKSRKKTFIVTPCVVDPLIQL